VRELRYARELLADGGRAESTGDGPVMTCGTFSQIWLTAGREQVSCRPYSGIAPVSLVGEWGVECESTESLRGWRVMSVFLPGSVGTIDPNDIGKVVFDGAVAQLGHGILPPIPVAEAAVGAQALAGPAGLPYASVSATLRYPVLRKMIQDYDPGPPGPGIPLWGLGIELRWRNGDGRIEATLVETDVPVPASPPEVLDVASRPLIKFDSADPVKFGVPNPFFLTNIAMLDENDPLREYRVDERFHVYHLEVTLSGRQPYENPPAIAAIAVTGRLGAAGE
jgi:hypothetical protein